MSTCSTVTQTVEAPRADSPNSTAVSAPHIVNYPRPQPQDDGRFAAMGSLIGTVVDRLFWDDDKADKADAAQDAWKDLVDYAQNRGYAEVENADTERGKRAPFEQDLGLQYGVERNQADAQYGFANFARLARDPHIDDLDDQRGRERSYAVKHINFADTALSQRAPYILDLDTQFGADRAQADDHIARAEQELLDRQPWRTDLSTQRVADRNQADTEFGVATTEGDKRTPFEQDLLAQLDDERDRADLEINRGDSLSTCVDSAWDKLCEYVDCGYRPDYQAIAARVQAAAQAQYEAGAAQICRDSEYYSCGSEASRLAKLKRETAFASITALADEFEKERRFAWETNTKLRFDLANVSEAARNGRIRLGAEFDAQGTNIADARYNAHNRNRYESIDDARGFDTDATTISTQRLTQHNANAFEHYGQGVVRDRAATDTATTRLAHETDRAFNHWQQGNAHDTNATQDSWRRLVHETDRMTAHYQQGHVYDTSATSISTERLSSHNLDAFRSLEMGTKLLADSGQAYNWLAESLRLSAQHSRASGFGLATTMAVFGAVVLPLFSRRCGNVSSIPGLEFFNQDYCCEDEGESGGGGSPQTPP